jgi:tetratricopeptide (TPR) repeat protein
MLFTSLAVCSLLAAPDVPLARTLYGHGVEEFRSGHYEAALDDFQRAYREAPLAELLYDVAQAERALGRLADAERDFARYIAEAPQGRRIEQARQHLGDVRAALAVEQRASAPTPAPGTRASSVPVAKSAPAPVTEAAPAAAVEAPRPSHHTLRPGALWMGVAGLAVAAAGAIVWGLAVAQAGKYQPNGQTYPVPLATYDAESGPLNDQAYAGEGLLATGSVAVAAAIVWALSPAGR